MRILCLNANTTPFITTLVGDEMRRTLGDTATVLDCTPDFGPAVIKTRLDVSVASHAIVDAAAQQMNASAAAEQAAIDAIMLAVSFDTGRDALREALSIPVVGMSEASIALARMHGRRLGYISVGSNITDLYHETLTHCDLDFDLAGWQSIDAPSAYQPGDNTELDTAICQACESLVDQGADVAVLLGAVMAGAAFRVNGRTPIPTVDGASAGALMARSMVDLQLPKATRGSFSTSKSGGLNGVSTALSALQQPDQST